LDAFFRFKIPASNIKKKSFATFFFITVVFDGTAGFITAFKKDFLFKFFFFLRLVDMGNYGGMLNLNFKLI